MLTRMLGLSSRSDSFPVLTFLALQSVILHSFVCLSLLSLIYISQWHNAAVIRLDGSIAIQHSETVDKSTHELVYRYGRPYFWREVDPAMPCGSNDGMEEVTFEHGLLVQPATTTSMATAISWGDVPMDETRAPASRHASILARGLGRIEKDGMGTIQ